jgi:hypothetical protein
MLNKNEVPNDCKQDTDLLRYQRFTRLDNRGYGPLRARGSVVVKALCCKPEGRGFKSRSGGFFLKGRAIAQAVSRRLPTAAARVQNRVWSCGIL